MSPLVPIVYDELRRMAHRHISREDRGHALQISALVDEACLRGPGGGGTA